MCWCRCARRRRRTHAGASPLSLCFLQPVPTSRAPRQGLRDLPRLRRGRPAASLQVRRRLGLGPLRPSRGGFLGGSGLSWRSGGQEAASWPRAGPCAGQRPPGAAPGLLWQLWWNRSLVTAHPGESRSPWCCPGLWRSDEGLGVLDTWPYRERFPDGGEDWF